MKETFNSLIQNRHSNLQKLKQQGKKIIGYLCSYCPEELIYAAGMVPVRVLGGEGPFTLSSNYLHSFYCPYSHGCLNEGLKGEDSYLDGLVFSYACEHTRGAYDSWRVHRPVKFSHFLDMPGWVNTREALHFYVQELKLFKKGLEETFGISILPESLEYGIELCNRSRASLREIYHYKQSSSPVVSGTESFSAALSSMVSAKQEHHILLSRFLTGVKRRKRSLSGKRVMVLGTDLHQPQILEAIEGQGAVVVADELCTGARYIWEDVKADGDPLEAIARRYLTGIYCPVKHPMEGRLSFIEKMLREFRVEKVLFLHNRYCDPEEWAEPFIRRKLQEKNIPWAEVEMGGESLAADQSRVARAAKELIGG